VTVADQDYAAQVDFEGFSDGCDDTVSGVNDFLKAGVQLFGFCMAGGVLELFLLDKITLFVLGLGLLYVFFQGWLISVLIGSETNTESFSSDAAAVGILPNLYISAMNGEEDRWDFVMVLGICVVIAAGFVLGLV